MTLTVGSLCSGAGGLDLAVSDVLGSVRHAWVAENDPDASRVLAERFGVPNLGDISEVDWRRVEPVDVLCAGYPCQDFSNAGRRAGLDGDRGQVWFSVARAVRVLRPRVVFLENVDAHVVRGFPRVLADLAALGFDAEWATLRASDVGAPHQRNRLFVVATPTDTSGEHIRLEPIAERARSGSAVVGDDRPGDDDGVAVWRETVSRRGRPGEELIRAPRTLMPTPTASRAVRRGQPSSDLAATRYAQGRRMLDDAVALLPTPTSSVAERGGMPAPGREGGNDLREAIGTLLPTPAARDWKGTGYNGQLPNALLPTPRATEGAKGGPNQRGSSGDLTLTSSVMLLPTPTATNSHGNAKKSSGELLLPGIVQAADRWRDYGPAIARWEAVLGRPAPDPTVTGKRGGRRLSGRFVEWLMGWPEGWVTDLVDNTAALRICGNGVVPQCASAAYRDLMESRWPA